MGDKDNKNMTISHHNSEIDDKSLLTLLKDYSGSDYVPFHMPGHKRKGFAHLLGNDCLDITEIDGFDNLHNACGVLKDAQDRASKVFNVAHTRFLINGSTAGVLAGIKSVCDMGDSILIARNCHKSVYNAIELLHLDVNYVLPTYHEQGFYGEVSAKDVEIALANNKNIKLVVIVSPTYEGVISDIRGIADICHRCGVTLFIDEAHGAHLSFAGFEKSARELGADIVVNSIHKTLPSLTQTALLHINSDRVDIDRIDDNLSVFQSSSPSYLLMSSIDGCVNYLESVGLDDWCDKLDCLREKLSHTKRIKLIDKDSLNAYGYDKSKIVFDVSRTNIRGVALAKMLREKHKIECEMSSLSHVILMSGAGDTPLMYDRLFNAISEIDDMLLSINYESCAKSLTLPKKAVDCCKIDTLSKQYVKIDDCMGSIAGDTILAYPPGSPIIVKGEIFDKGVVEHLKALLDSGVNVLSRKGIKDGLVLVTKD